ncbi:MAG TPA: electron transfer flavoprotein subunit beta/FixA family protein [Candidatus Brocadiia bacterium]|nr:electron transfer flavoprotein subunit beta/FixA family protein [Candidatus Brocadiia bacterium]
MADLKILVLVKQTFTTEARIQLDAQGKIVDKGIKYVISPYDEYAVEKAIQMQEAGGGIVRILTVGSDKTLETMRIALAMGAAEAVRVWDPCLETADSQITAQVIAAAMKKVPFDLVLAGKAAVDDQSYEVPARVAGLLGLPLVNAITSLSVSGTTAKVERETDAGKETIEVPLPAVLTAEKGLAEPRYPTLPNIMKAKKKPVQVYGLGDIGLSAAALKPAVQVLGLSTPAPRKGAAIIGGSPQEAVKELVRRLKEEAKVL